MEECTRRGHLVGVVHSLSITLVEVEQRILNFVRAFEAKRGRPPSRKLVAQYFPKASPTTLSSCLQTTMPRQVASGKRRATNHNSRRQNACLLVPLQGCIAASFSAHADNTAVPKGKLSLDLSALGVALRPGVFALQVQGDSMIEAHIHDGDIVLLEPGCPQNGDIVAAMHDGCLLLKRWLVVGKVPFLKAENSTQPGMVRAVDRPICGVFRGLLRLNQPRRESTRGCHASVRYRHHLRI